MQLNGHQLIGQESFAARGKPIYAINPATGERIEPGYGGCGIEEVDRACQLAWTVFDKYRETTLTARADFLEEIAAQIEAIGDELIERAMLETGLPRARLEGERGRTCGQLRLFSKVVRAGEWLDVRIDPELPERSPLPRSDLRQRRIALGPVAVFGASNFPLAFSVAGGDTASALAAGCPVIVKAHSAHPGTSELVGRAVQKAIATCELPSGVFSLLYGAGNELGQALVTDPRIQAVGFTGSRSGGTALMQAANNRPQPIPVYAEMSSINPVVLMPAALEARAEALGKDFIASLNMGAGQFCTNPGLILSIKSAALDRFKMAAAEDVRKSAPQTMLTPGIHSAYSSGLLQLRETGKVQEIAASNLVGDSKNLCHTTLFAVNAEDFISDERLHAEVFGSCALIIECENMADLKKVLEHLEGQLTATVHMLDADYAAVEGLLPTLERKAGRILANAWPTGVEVCDAMVHGGPWPASSDGRSTSVGTAAIHRFLRPVCYQGIPQTLLPDALRDGNPLGVSRLVNGTRE
ncbi:aldehyde dehydrogenase (NADP(+)) [Marinobacter sp. ANT_B65]|uniref:aldehyde dehydrogenase (NADP(+)) n=1 Tax=Marinobacter sp. ANT_B65 TaxID=2039467 RepID=UPI000BBE5814|nr:aldehyde dehydrogenase (NADP(+)) [Marinobacter sp. ANT_B65]PCM45968.1 aldehyde dehydrogenase (NADP(+)) [Marinobacter sp. ANT_B65]